MSGAFWSREVPSTTTDQIRGAGGELLGREGERTGRTVPSEFVAGKREQVGRLRRQSEDEERRAKVEVRTRQLEELRADESLGPVHDQLAEELP